MYLYFGSVIWSEPVLIIVHKSCVGNFLLYILSRGAMKRFCPVIDCVPLRS